MRSSTTKPFVQGHLAKHCALDSGCLSGTHVLDSETTIICLSVNMYALSSPVGTTTFLVQFNNLAAVLYTQADGENERPNMLGSC